MLLPYTREVFAATQHWTEAHGPPGSLRGYNEAALVLSKASLTRARSGSGVGSVVYCRPDGAVQRTSPLGSCSAFHRGAA